MAIPRNLGNLAQGADSSGVLGTTKGGTGLTAVGTNGQVLQSNGSALVFATPATTSPSGSTGQVQYNNAGAFGAVSSGTSGQVLTSAGAGAVPTWTSPSAGAMNLIQTINVTSPTTSADFTITPDQYDYYVIEFRRTLADAGQGIFLQLGNGTYATSAYAGTGGRISGGTISGRTAPTGGASLDFGNNEIGSNYAGGIIHIFGVKQFNTNISMIIQTTTAFPRYYFGSYYTPSFGSDITNFRLIGTSGTQIQAGNFSLYGISS
jgi:hypothetical protein